MASGFQSVWRRLSSAEVAAVERPRGAAVAMAGDPFSLQPELGNFRIASGPKRFKSSRHIRGRWLQISYAVLDLLLASSNWFIALYLRILGDSLRAPLDLHRGGLELGLPVSRYIAFLLLYAVVLLLFCQSQDLYRTVRTRTALAESVSVFKAVFYATVLLSAFVYLSGVRIVSRLVVAYAGALNLVTFAAWRIWKRQIILRRASRGVGTRNVLIVGAGRVGQALATHIETNKLLGYCFKGFLDANHTTDPRLLGKIEDLSRVAKAEFVDEVFISIPSEREVVKNVAVEARRHRLAVKVVPDLYDGFGWNAPIYHIGHFPVMELHWEPIPTLGLFLKRVVDVLGSGLSLALLSPIFIAIGIGIRLDSPGPMIYASSRVGRKGRKFICYKFRTMIKEADVVKQQLRHLNERKGPTFKITNDPRVTRFGKFLRKHSLDELPQLWNVIKGEMSLVGPRPHPLDDYEQYEIDHLRRLDVKPGITGLWQVVARRDPSFETNMKLDLQYIERWSLRLDVKIMLETIAALLRSEGS